MLLKIRELRAWPAQSVGLRIEHGFGVEAW